MAKKYLDKVYKTDPDALTDLYNDWSGGYDAELTESGYATPRRLARLLSGVAPDRTVPILDFGCGTGMGGDALSQAGFTCLDGCDLSEGMLGEAQAKGIYRQLWQTEEGAALPFAFDTYRIVTAVGVISVGAAPAETLGWLANQLTPGTLFAFSFNGHTMEDPAYTTALNRLFADGIITERARETGPHLGEAISTVFVVEKV